MYFRGQYGQYASPLYYSMCFPLKILTKSTDLYFDACPSYLYLPFVRDPIYKLHQDNPYHKFKFLIIIRDPIDRAISNIKAEISYTKMIQQFDLGATRNSECC